MTTDGGDGATDIVGPGALGARMGQTARRPLRAPRSAAGAGSQAQTARRQGWFKRLELAVAKGLRGERLIQTHAVSMR